MKYNPKACNTYAMLPEFLARHPLAPEPQGFLACMYELQEMLKEITGMQGVASPRWRAPRANSPAWR